MYTYIVVVSHSRNTNLCSLVLCIVTQFDVLNQAYTQVRIHRTIDLLIFNCPDYPPYSRQDQLWSWMGHIYWFVINRLQINNEAYPISIQLLKHLPWREDSIQLLLPLGALSTWLIPRSSPIIPSFSTPNSRQGVNAAKLLYETDFEIQVVTGSSIIGMSTQK